MVQFFTDKHGVLRIMFDSFHFLNNLSIIDTCCKFLTAEQKMSAVSALILVTVAAFLIHGSSAAIRCYECSSGAHEIGCYYGRPQTMAPPKACLPIYDACWIGEGSGTIHERRRGKNMKIVILAHLTQTYRHLADWRSHTQLD